MSDAGSNTGPLKVALLLNSADMQPWQHRLVEQIDGDKHLSLCGFLDIENLTHHTSSPAMRLLQLVYRIETRLFLARRHKPDRTFAGLTDSRIARLSHEKAQASEIKTHVTAADIVISLVPIDECLAEKLIAHTRLWVLAEGTGNSLNSPHFGFAEMFNRNGISSYSLVELSPNSSREMARGTVQQQFCYARNKRFLLEKSVALVLRELRRQQKHAPITARAATPNQYAHAEPPTITGLISYVGRLFANLAPKAYKAVRRKTGGRYNRWSLFIGKGRFEPRVMPYAIETKSPDDEFWADPFLFRAPSKQDIHVFFESFDFSTGLGKISVGLVEGGHITRVGDALVRPYHLSYPLVFEHEGEILMIPETASTRQIEIWRCIEYPLKWELYKTVMENTSCADTTLVEHNGEWWMFTNMSVDAFNDHCSELYVFRVDSPLLNSIEPHELNPVVADARTARNAGRIAVRDGKLTRLVQNNAYQYGYGFALMEIEELSLQSYREKHIWQADPGFKRGISSTHQMDQLDDVHVFDGLRQFG